MKETAVLGSRSSAFQAERTEHGTFEEHGGEGDREAGAEWTMEANGRTRGHRGGLQPVVSILWDLDMRKVWILFCCDEKPVKDVSVGNEAV